MTWLLGTMTSARKIAGHLVALAIASAAPAAAQAPRPGSSRNCSRPRRRRQQLTIYASMNEEEALPYWAIFEQATGIKVNFVRMSDSLSGRASRSSIAPGSAAGTWSQPRRSIGLANEILAQFDPPQAKDLIPQARDPNRRWYGYSGNYNTPAYNTDQGQAGRAAENL